MTSARFPTAKADLKSAVNEYGPATIKVVGTMFAVGLITFGLLWNTLFAQMPQLPSREALWTLNREPAVEFIDANGLGGSAKRRPGPRIVVGFQNRVPGPGELGMARAGVVGGRQGDARLLHRLADDPGFGERPQERRHPREARGSLGRARGRLRRLPGLVHDGSLS